MYYSAKQPMCRLCLLVFRRAICAARIRLLYPFRKQNLSGCVEYPQHYISFYVYSQRFFSSSTKASVPLEKTIPKNIRNFSIVAHVDHGKSTLADRFLEISGLKSVDSEKQILDDLAVEKERGITVKAQTVSLPYSFNGVSYLLNLIDTPGHVDFSYEVSRSLAACQGVVLLIDASQGVQAQTLANFYLAFEAELPIIPVINKIDLPSADCASVEQQVAEMLDFDRSEILQVSAKTGFGVTQLLEAIIDRLPPPPPPSVSNFRALIYDSSFEHFRGAIPRVAVTDGSLKPGQTITCFHSKETYTVQEVGLLQLERKPISSLTAGHVGYIIANMKQPSDAQVGDTVFSDVDIESVTPFEGFRKAKQVVFACFYPIDDTDVNALEAALQRLCLNDSSVSMEVGYNSSLLGKGFRLGFLGMLHMDVFQQRLYNEYNADVLVTSPSIPYQIKLKPSAKKAIARFGTDFPLLSNPNEFPEALDIDFVLEPTVIGTFIFPADYLGTVQKLCISRGGESLEQHYLADGRVMMKWKLSLAEVINDFYSQLKILTSGYASFDYESSEMAVANIIKLSVLINSKPVDEFTTVVKASSARLAARKLALALRKAIPKQLIQVAIQVTHGGKVIARENIGALRKDVTAKLYGGDKRRAMKLLAYQSAGKRRMREVGNVKIPREAFLDVFRLDATKVNKTNK